VIRQTADDSALVAFFDPHGYFSEPNLIFQSVSVRFTSARTDSPSIRCGKRSISRIFAVGARSGKIRCNLGDGLIFGALKAKYFHEFAGIIQNVNL